MHTHILDILVGNTRYSPMVKEAATAALRNMVAQFKVHKLPDRQAIVRSATNRFGALSTSRQVESNFRHQYTNYDKVLNKAKLHKGSEDYLKFKQVVKDFIRKEYGGLLRVR